MTADAFVQGLLLALQWPSFGYLLLGVVIGIWLGVVPGLGGIIGIVLILPFTYGMETLSAFAILLGIFAVTSTSDTIASVMLGIPGTASSQATVLDGHPLAQRGEAARAFGAAFTVSAFGGIFGAVILAVSLPVALPIILRFNNPELFALAILGLAMVGSLSGRSVAKGLAAASFGLLLSTIGYAQDAAIPRYWMDQTYLLDKLPLIPVVLGLFAMPELIDLAARDRAIARIQTDRTNWSQLGQGIGDAFRNWWLALRCSAIGVYIGMIPGVGGAVVDWIAYGHALQSTRNPETYGTGDIRGVIAPEAANNAVRGGSLIPTVAFGVPGSAMNALLLGALLIQGLQPGKPMLTTELPITFAMIWDIAIANIIAAVLLMVLANQIAKLSFISGHLIVPGVLLFVFMGAWLSLSEIGDWITLMIFGALGYLMKLGGWPRPPVVLAFILGSLMENSFLLSWKIHEGLGWMDRPIVLVIFALVAATLVFSIRRNRKRDRVEQEGVAPAEVQEEPSIPFASLTIGLIFLLAFAAALIPLRQWPTLVLAFPLLAILPGLALSSSVFGREIVARPHINSLWREFVVMTQVRRGAALLALCVAMIAVAIFVGQKIALVMMVAIYLARWGGYGWRVVLPYTIATAAILIGFYDRVLHIFWLKPVFSQAIHDMIPQWMPEWLIL